MRRALTGLVAAAVAVGSVAAAWAVTRDGADGRGPVTAAVDAVPLGAGTVDVTVWQRLPGSVDDAVLRDLSTRSVVAPLDDELRERFGWSVTDLGWETYARTPEGGVVVLGLGDLDAGEVDEAFGSVADRDGSGWRIKDASGASSSFAATFAHVRVLRAQHVLVAGETAEALTATVATVRGRERSLLADPRVRDLLDGVRDADAFWLQRREALCAEDRVEGDEATAVRRVEAQNSRLVDPVWGLRAIVDRPERRLAFGTAFATPSVAREQALVREALTRGPFIGRGGAVAEQLVDLRATVDGSAVLLDLATTDDTEDLMSDVGPVVFAGCAVPRS